MTTFKTEHDAHDVPANGKLTLAEILEIFAAGQLPLKFTAYDGSTAGPEDATVGLDLKTPRGTTYLATAPGDLGIGPRLRRPATWSRTAFTPAIPTSCSGRWPRRWTSSGRRRGCWPTSSARSASSI